jgi:ATP-dependent RNA helicase RhlB
VTTEATSQAAGGRTFDSFDLPEEVRAGIRAARFERCTPIQEKTLPISLPGRDVAGQAQTGTGKTAAFLITLFTRLLERPRKPGASGPRALVIAPTRELVVQITDDARVLGSGTPFVIHAVYGGVDYRKQRLTLEEGVDVLIGTPGRLIDYFKQKAYDLRAIDVLVIDEADRMFDMGFIRDLRFILRRLPPVEERQSMLFSATLGFDVMELAYLFMNEAVQVSVSPEQVTAEKVEHLVYHVGLDEKIRMLLGILQRERDARVLVFVNMRRTAERIEDYLAANGFSGAAITGDVDQRKRLRILADFKEGTLPILVATDVASRGLHIEGVTHVINYDLPLDAEDYVHRVGRTARAGASGVAYSLACEDYVQGLEAIEEFIGFKLPHAFPEDGELAGNVRHPPRRPRRTTNGRPVRGRPQGGSPRPERGRHAGAAAKPPPPRAKPTGQPSEGPTKRHRRRPRSRTSGAPSGSSEA